jgi:hypothetical protein
MQILWGVNGVALHLAREEGKLVGAGLAHLPDFLLPTEVSADQHGWCRTPASTHSMGREYCVLQPPHTTAYSVLVIPDQFAFMAMRYNWQRRDEVR